MDKYFALKQQSKNPKLIFHALMNQTGPNGQGSNAIKYSSTGGMNKALRLALEFYKIHKRLPNAHECHHISQRALELLAISDPGARHYVTGPQIFSQFNNVARDLSSLDKRLEKRKIVSESDNPAYSEAQRRTQQWEEDRYRVLQQVAVAKRGGTIAEEFDTGELGAVGLGTVPTLAGVGSVFEV